MSAWRIGHLIKGLGRGGAESLLPQTIRHHGEAFEYRVAYFLPWKDALVAEVEAAGAPVTCLGARSAAGMLWALPRVIGWIRRERIDLLHCHLPLAGIVGRLAGKWTGVPVVYTEHNLQERYHRLTRWGNRATWSLQNQVIAVSAEVASSIQGSMPSLPRVSVVHNGIELDRLQASRSERWRVRDELGVPGNGLLIGTVAVFRPQKRLNRWLEAFATVASQRADVYGVLVGDGPLRIELETYAARLGLAEKVRFPGLQAPIAPWLAAMDVFLISSEFEGLPLALLEAMAAGLPVVATTVGGIPEVIEDGVSGVLVTDPRESAAHVTALLNDASRRNAIARAAQGRVESRFSVARMAGELEAAYADLLSGSAQPGATP